MDSAGPNLPHYGSTSPLRLILSFGISDKAYFILVATKIK